MVLHVASPYNNVRCSGVSLVPTVEGQVFSLSYCCEAYIGQRLKQQFAVRKRLGLERHILTHDSDDSPFKSKLIDPVASIAGDAGVVYPARRSFDIVSSPFSDLFDLLAHHLGSRCEFFGGF